MEAVYQQVSQTWPLSQTTRWTPLQQKPWRPRSGSFLNSLVKDERAELRADPCSQSPGLGSVTRAAPGKAQRVELRRWDGAGFLGLAQLSHKVCEVQD